MAEEELGIRILRVDPGQEIVHARTIQLRTTRGEIPLIMHSHQTQSRAVLCVSGARGGFDGPALLYARLGRDLPSQGIVVARMSYRLPDEFDECLLDTMAALAFLQGVGVERVALIGHSFGGAVAINAGIRSPLVVTVIAVASQLYGAYGVAELAPKPLLLVHGTADTILPDLSSRLLYENAKEPKTLKLFEGADHRLNPIGAELHDLVTAWVTSKT